MSILGLTLDYGPFQWLDRYHINQISNTSDEEGRYAFGKQPGVVEWNLRMFGEVLKLANISSRDIQLVRPF
jgi:serine/tyrosine/threonine adenylyltransferase